MLTIMLIFLKAAFGLKRNSYWSLGIKKLQVQSQKSFQKPLLLFAITVEGGPRK
jgi:hypothetical protein